MREDIRRAVAYTAVGRASGRFAGSIYSYERSAYSNMSECYDYEAGSHFDGSRSGGMYHYGVGAHIDLDVKAGRFSGYDYDSGSHFEGMISGRQINLYDYGEGRYFDYSV